MKKLVLIILSLLFLVSCYHQPRQPTQATQVISFENAIDSLIEGISKLKNEASKDNTKFGLVPSEITVNFNIGVNKTDGSKLGVKLPITGIDFASDFTQNIKTMQGNSIQIKFKNLHFSNKNEYFYDKGFIKGRTPPMLQAP